MATPNYKLKDDHVVTAFHLRTAYTTLDSNKVNKAGDTITGDIFKDSNTNPLNALATKQYVLDNAGTGGGGGGTGQLDLIRTPDGTTQVKCEADGIKIQDDSV
jgi:hypothetical protein